MNSTKLLSSLFAATLCGAAFCATKQPPSDFNGLFPPDVKTVGIVSVSSLIPTNVFVFGTNLLVKAGYRVKAMPNILKMEPPKVRAKLFEHAWIWWKRSCVQRGSFRKMRLKTEHGSIAKAG